MIKTLIVHKTNFLNIFIIRNLFFFFKNYHFTPLNIYLKLIALRLQLSK